MRNNERLPAKVVVAANLILIGAAAACLFILSYYGYYYVWTRQREFSSWMGVFLYCIAPAVLALALLASLRLQAAHRINLALLLCSAGVSVYVLEMLLALWFSLPSVKVAEVRKMRVETAKAAGVAFDGRSPRQVIGELTSQGTDAVPPIFPQLFLEDHKDGMVRAPVSVKATTFLPLSGIANKLVVLCNETGRYVTYRSDHHGFNNPQAVWADVPVDVVAVGDSFVHGYCVDRNAVTILRQRYPRTLNLGMAGNGPLTMLATIKEYARLVKPRIVLWFHYEGNDLDDLRVEAENPLLRRYLTEDFSQNLFARQADVDRFLTDYLETIEGKSDFGTKLEEVSALLTDFDELRRKLPSVVKLSRARQKLGLVHSERDRPEIPYALPGSGDESQAELLYKIFVEAKQTIDEWRGRLYVVYLPTWARYALTISNRERDVALGTAARAGLPVIDLHESFMRHGDPLMLYPFGLPGHYTEEGNQLVADEVLRSISGPSIPSPSRSGV